MAEQVQQQHDHVAHGDDQHQIGDAQLGVPVAETVQKRVDGFQRQFLPDQGSNVSLTGNGDISKTNCKLFAAGYFMSLRSFSFIPGVSALAAAR